MTLTGKNLTIWRKLMLADTDDFEELTRIADLDPKSDFVGADLADVDFGTADLRAYRFDGADLRGANLFKAKLGHEVLLGADLHGAKLPKALGLTGFHASLVELIIERLKRHRRALVTAPPGTGVTRIVEALLRAMQTQRAPVAALVLSGGKHGTRQLLHNLSEAKTLTVEYLENLTAGTRVAHCYIADYPTFLRIMSSSTSPARGTLENIFSHVIFMDADQVNPDMIDQVISHTDNLLQVAFTQIRPQNPSVLGQHFVVDEQISLEYISDLNGQEGDRIHDRRHIASYLESGPEGLHIESIMSDFVDHLADADMLGSKSLVLCTTRAQAESAAEAVIRIYRERGLPEGSNGAYDVAHVPSSHEELAYILGTFDDPQVVCCTSQALDDSAETAFEAVALLVGSVSGRARRLLSRSPIDGGALPLVFDYSGAARGLTPPGARRRQH